MSKSRLEKFLYALYSLDSSDLPNPLSRIEELYGCLVTGDETPTFKPLSRVEKYLMAILGVYDVDSLPNPLSRVEALLYKLATGDDSLDDVKSFLSEHEELLAEIIRNGGVGGNIDIEYVFYTLSTEYSTLYNTAEKPIKSAILKGQTLVNLIKGGDVKKEITYSIGTKARYYFNKSMLKANVDYLLIYEVTDFSGDDSNISFNENNDYGITRSYFNKNGIHKTKVNFSDVGAIKDFIIFYKITGSSLGGFINNVMLVEYQEGMENWNIPYFEGMQSVKMPVLTTTGKNLFDGELVKNKYYNNSTGELVAGNNNLASVNPIRVNPNTSIVLSTSANLVNNNHYICEYASDGTFIKRTNSSKITTSETTYFIKFHFAHETINESPNVQLEEGSTATSYEPYKSNILTVNKEVELRGIGDVQDTLDLLTGELTERIGEITFDGSDDETWGRIGSLSDKYETSFFTLSVDNVKRNINYITKICDKLPALADYCHTEDIEGVTQVIDNQISIRVLKTSLSDDSVEGLKAYLQSNPITVQYQFITKSVKTADLSVVDQDGNDTELSTFNDITHVTLSSEGLIPEAELEVATKNEEVLNTMSLEMDDISTTQNALQETSNTQSENVDSTMIATTEIYEGLL